MTPTLQLSSTFVIVGGREEFDGGEISLTIDHLDFRGATYAYVYEMRIVVLVVRINYNLDREELGLS